MKRLDKFLIIAILVSAILLLIVIIYNPEENKSNSSFVGLNLKNGLLNVKWSDDRISIKTKFEKYPNYLLNYKNHADDFQYTGGSICGFKVDIWTFRFDANGGKLREISISFDSKMIENMEDAFIKLRDIIMGELGPPIEKQANHLNKSAEWNVLIDSSKSIRVSLNREIYDWSPNNEGLLLMTQWNYIDTSSHIERVEYQSTNNMVDSTIFGLLSYGMTVDQVRELNNIYVAGLSDFNYNDGKLFSLLRKTILFGDSVKIEIYFDQQGSVKSALIYDFSLCNQRTANGTLLFSITNEGKSEIKRIKEYFTRLYGVPSVKDSNWTQWFCLSTTMWHSSSSDISLLQFIEIENHKKIEGVSSLFFERKKKT